jgi:phosphomannomutase/phosphomannomutase/phosphoglucomutase
LSYQQQAVVRSVFRAYDIRGIIGTDLNADSFYSIGLALACRLSELNRKQIFLARDGRLTSLDLAQALMQGLLDSGIDVVDLGAVATPVLYFATYTQNIDSGVMVTASHNPAEYNGIKMVLAGTTLAQKDIDYIYQLVSAGKRITGAGTYSSFDIIDIYEQRIISDIHLKRRLKVVVDCGNGIAGPVIPKVIEALGCDVVPLFCDVDGRFPNHHPDPTIEANLVDLKAAVAEHKADIGLAFDGDADRLGILTNTGAMIWPDRIMILYVREVLSRLPGATIVYDVKCSSHLEHEIVAAGGIAKLCPTGHSIVKAFMKKENAALAGEMSGHLFFKDRWYGFDDALYSACRLLEIIAASERTVSQLFDSIPDSINTPELKIAIAEDKKFDFMKQFMKTAQFENGRVIDVDGMRVEFAEGWGLVRASNTSPNLVARFEANNAEQLRVIQDLFKNEMLKVDSGLVISW